MLSVSGQFNNNNNNNNFCSFFTLCSSMFNNMYLVYEINDM